MKTKIIILLLLFSMLFSFPVSAHSGKTDSNGGHYDHQNGGYHYHHGYSAHSHYDIDGDGIIDCPYEMKNKENNKTSTTSIVFSMVLLTLLLTFYPGCYVYMILNSVFKDIINKQKHISFGNIDRLIKIISAIITFIIAALVATLII